MLNAVVSQGAQVDAFEQPLPPAQQDRSYGHVHLIYETCAKVLLDGVRATSNTHIHPVRGLTGPVQRVLNAAGDEVERCAAFHLTRRTRW